MVLAVATLGGLALLLWLPLTFRLNFIQEKGKVNLAFQFCPGICPPLFCLKKEAYFPGGEKHDWLEKLREGIKRQFKLPFWRRLQKYRSWILSRFTCRRLKIFLEIGTGDPAVTAWVASSAWGALAWLYAALKSRVRIAFKSPELQVVPYFSGPYFRLQGDFVVTAPLGHIIGVGVMFMALLVAQLWRRILRERREGP
ncbi:MAG: hypothetical protein PWP65_1813 [Clostridia bacterium]|nr:hypothetical protein [Clostridia bacterium]